MEGAPGTSPTDGSDPQATEALADGLLRAGRALWRFVHAATLDPDTAFRDQIPEVRKGLENLAVELEKTTEIPRERIHAAPEMRQALEALSLEGRFLSVELRELQRTLDRLALEVPRLRAESVPLQRELQSLESLSRRLIGLHAIASERKRSLSVGTRLVPFAERRVNFVAAEMRGTAEDCLRFRAQVAFAFVKHETSPHGTS